MSLVLPDGELDKIGADSNVLGMDCCESCARNIARAQARHMARECLDWWEGEADCYNVNQRKHFEAWLRQEGVLDE